MSLAVVLSRGLAGLDAPLVTVEVHLAGGLPAFHLVGLPDTEVRESHERVRAALQNAKFEFPARKITVNLAPASSPDRHTHRPPAPAALPGHSLWANRLPSAAVTAAKAADREVRKPTLNRRSPGGSAPHREADPQFGWSSLLARREARYQTSVVSWESEFPLLSFQLSLSLSPGMAPRTLNIR